MFDRVATRISEGPTGPNSFNNIIINLKIYNLQISLLY